jgi:hypothetical protein
MLGHYLKIVKVLSATESEPFKLPAENRMACTMVLNAGVGTPVLQQSIDGVNWTTVPGVTLAAGVTGWNFFNSSSLAPLPLIRVTAASGLTAVTVAVVE